MKRALLLLALAIPAAARPARSPKEWYPVEQTITRNDVPREESEYSIFGAKVALSGRWLAISETVWSDTGEFGAAVHLFRRAPGRSGRPWRWTQQIEADPASALGLGSAPDFPLALGDHELAVAAPWPGGLLICRPDASGTWEERQTIPQAFGKNVWPQGKLLMSDRLLVFANVGGSLFVFSRDGINGEWIPDREFPSAMLRREGDFFLRDGRLAFIRAGSADERLRIEVHEKSEDGTWLEADTIGLPGLSQWPFVFSGGLHAAFDGKDLIVLANHADFLGNPILGTTLQRFRKEAGEWTPVDEVLLPSMQERVEVESGMILAHGYTTDFLGNPAGGMPLALDRGFRRRGNVRRVTGSASLDGSRFATSGTYVDFLGNSGNQNITVHLNPWTGWFRRK